MQEIKTIVECSHSRFDEAVNKFLTDGFVLYKVEFPKPNGNNYRAVLLKETINYIKPLPMK